MVAGAAPSPPSYLPHHKVVQRADLRLYLVYLYRRKQGQGCLRAFNGMHKACSETALRPGEATCWHA